ncbi:MAG: PA2169 family four-helix-bundle protein [Confluentibacter sp.]|jgi:uncharacterized protein (TIGR02284 family)|nr:PA2169 family four-helix-bundle protein [Confluentibacter sp.]
MEIKNAHEHIVSVLQELLQKNFDAEAGYKQVMQKSENRALKSWLQQKAQQRHLFATQLDFMIRELNATPATDGTLLGTVHRAWIDVKSTLSSHTDEALLEECIRGEKASVEEYEQQLPKVNDYPGIKELLSSQLTTIKSALETVKTLEDVEAV